VVVPMPEAYYVVLAPRGPAGAAARFLAVI
jgi:hypothetical protein